MDLDAEGTAMKCIVRRYRREYVPPSAAVLLKIEAAGSQQDTALHSIDLLRLRV